MQTNLQLHIFLENAHPIPTLAPTPKTGSAAGETQSLRPPHLKQDLSGLRRQF